MSTQPAIEVEQLVRDFKKGPRAVDGIDLAVSPGEIYGFLGPNGAGKSTTVLMLTTLLPPTSGRASVGGYDIVRQGSQVRATIGAALQEAALDAILTGREHLMLQGTLQGLPWIWIPAGFVIAMIVLAVNFVGDGLRDALDPRLNR